MNRFVLEATQTVMSILFPRSMASTALSIVSCAVTRILRKTYRSIYLCDIINTLSPGEIYKENSDDNLICISIKNRMV